MLKKISLVLFVVALFAITAQAQDWNAYVTTRSGPTYDTETVSGTNPRAIGVTLDMFCEATAYGTDVIDVVAYAIFSLDGGLSESYLITATGTNGYTDTQTLSYPDFIGNSISGYITTHYIITPSGATASGVGQVSMSWWY